MVTVATGGAELGKALVASREVRMISFTGGFVTGEQIARTAGLKKLAMDLGGNAPVIVMGDCDLEAAVESCLSGAFWAAGQNCIGTQRLLIQASIYEAFRERFVSQAQALVSRRPYACRHRYRPDDYPASGAECRASGERRVARGRHIALRPSAPRLVLRRYRIGKRRSSPVGSGATKSSRRWWFCSLSKPSMRPSHLANEPEYSLHAGIFTNDLATAMSAARRIEAGGVMINDSSDYRFDAMPFGGSKYGSLGREGVRFAYEEMTQPKVVCLNTLG